MKTATTFEVVRPYDVEVTDRVDATTLAEYSAYRDMDILDLPEEAQPIIFTCRALTRNERRKVRGFSMAEDTNELAFRYGLIDVRNIPGKNGRMEHVVPERKGKQPHSDDTLDALARLDIGDDDINDIGSAIYGLSFLAHGVRPRSQVPVSSVRACHETVRYLAELKKERETDEEE